MATFTEIDDIIDNLIIDLTAALNPSTGDVDANEGEIKIARRFLRKAKIAQRVIDKMGSTS